MALSPEEVRHVATLARLALTREEELRFGQQLSAILEAVDRLKGVATADVTPTAHVAQGQGPQSPPRPDAPRPSLGPDEALENAPVRAGSHFAVPRILE